MGTNMQRQAVPLIESERPLVGTGAEWRAASIPATHPGREAGVVPTCPPTSSVP
mgnify:CR=1 FL=1